MLSSPSPASVGVEKATSDLLTGPDWTTNMEICDLVNTCQWQAKDVIKPVKKRLQNKSPTVQLLALTLLETMVKNCGDVVHSQVIDREVLQDMVKIVRKKTDIQVRDKILLLLDSWQEAFGGLEGRYPQYYLAYADLRRSGLHFPRRSGDTVPIFTPPVTHPTPRLPVGHGMSDNSSVRPDESLATDIRNLSLSDLESIWSISELLSDMLQAVDANDRGVVKDEVIVHLISHCRNNQKKILNLVNTTGDGELLRQGLELNDNLQFLIAKHDGIASGSPVPIKAPKSVPVSNAQPAKVVPTCQDEEDENDGFEQLVHRKTRNKSVPSQNFSTYSCDQEASNTGALTIVTTSTVQTEASSSNPNNALVLAYQPTMPLSTTPRSKDQDMIDLLSITLSTNPSPPQTPVTPPPTSIAGVPEAPMPSTTQGFPYNPQQVPINQVCANYNNYVAPWAQQTTSQPAWQPQPQPQYQQYPPSYSPAPWMVPSSSYANRPASTTYQHVTHDNAGSPAVASGPLQQQNSFGSRTTYQQVTGAGSPALASRPLQQQNSFGSRTTNEQVNYNNAGSHALAFRPLQQHNSFSSRTTYQQVNYNNAGSHALASRPLQQQNSFGSRANSSNGGTGPPGSSTANKPFVPSYRLFEDLIDLRGADGGSKTSAERMLGGRK